MLFKNVGQHDFYIKFDELRQYRFKEFLIFDDQGACWPDLIKYELFGEGMDINTPAIFGIISGACLASIQIRRIIKGELPLFGPKAFSAASKIKLDSYDKIMIVIAACSFIVCMILLLVVL